MPYILREIALSIRVGPFGSGDIGFGSLLSSHLKRIEKFLHVAWIAAGGWQDYQLVPASFYEICSGRRNASRSLNEDFFTGSFPNEMSVSFTTFVIYRSL